MSITNLKTLDQVHPESLCPSCFKEYGYGNGKADLLAASCGHLYHKECLEALPDGVCLCSKKIEMVSEYVFINHAKTVDYGDKCSKCQRTFYQIKHNDQKLKLTNCGHIFDEGCIHKLVEESKGICTCGERIISAADYVFNGGPYDLCSGCKTNLESAEYYADAAGWDTDLCITNCGHVYMQRCLREVLYDKCYRCNAIVHDYQPYNLFDKSKRQVVNYKAARIRSSSIQIPKRNILHSSSCSSPSMSPPSSAPTLPSVLRVQRIRRATEEIERQRQLMSNESLRMSTSPIQTNMPLTTKEKDKEPLELDFEIIEDYDPEGLRVEDFEKL